MKQLRQYIRKILLTEAAKGPADIGDMVVEIEFTPGEWIAVSLWSLPLKNNELAASFTLASGEEYTGFKTRVGEVHAEKAGSSIYAQPNPCSGAYGVVWATAEGAPGFGPMLYDIAMELAGDDGLMCDRGTVSKEATRVWEYYLNNRPDVITKQLDDFKTPFLQDPGKNDPSDDCNQRTFRRKERYENHHNASDPEFKQKFLDHWSTKVYVKTSGTPILDELEAAGKVTRK
jgi:hypothetical protein